MSSTSILDLVSMHMQKGFIGDEGHMAYGFVIEMRLLGMYLGSEATRTARAPRAPPMGPAPPLGAAPRCCVEREHVVARPPAVHRVAVSAMRRTTIN